MTLHATDTAGNPEPVRTLAARGDKRPPAPRFATADGTIVIAKLASSR